MQTWVCAFGILGLSALSSCSSHFHFKKGPFRRSEDCNMCYDNDCLDFDVARCSYYVEAASMLKNDEQEEDPHDGANVAMKQQVDTLIFDMVNKVNAVHNEMECIPYVSRYSNCNKENVCLGCKECSCSFEGKWNCTTANLCHTKNPPLNIDHRVLLMVLESLIDAGASRPRKVKRAVTAIPDQMISPLTLEQMSEWLYGRQPLNMIQNQPAEITSTVASTERFKDPTTPVTDLYTKRPELTLAGVATTTPETDYVAFDEVLRSIAVDTKGYNRRKLPMDNDMNNKTFNVDYMIMDDDNYTFTDFDDNKDDVDFIFKYIENDNTATESTVDSSTKIVIDLLEAAKQVSGNTNVTKDYNVKNNAEDNINIGFENTNDIIEYNAVNIMKRDVAVQEKAKDTPKVVSTVTFIVNTTNTTNKNNNDEAIDLKHSVLTPLNKIIINKLKELESLKRIKEKLLKYLKTDGESQEILEKENNNSKTSFSIYNLAMESGLGGDLRRTNSNSYDKYMYKLKSDILEVIRDVMDIQKHKYSDIPEDLKTLIHAMKRYVYTNKDIEEKMTKSRTKKPKASRRQMNTDLGRCEYISFKDCIVQIIEVIDKDMPKSNALSSLSPTARRIMKHVVYTLYTDDLTMPGLRVHSENYNMTTDLNNIGTKWQDMTDNIMSSSPFSALYRMKLLHYELIMDLSKMNDALALINFAHSRRMLHTLDSVSGDILYKINSGLLSIHNKIQTIMRYSQKLQQTSTVSPRPTEVTTINFIKEALNARKKKKRSFIKHIRSLLNTSKKDIAELLHRKVPKSEIVKHLARKKLDEISQRRYTEYEETMRRWQKNLLLTPRIRRSLLDQFKTRIKNIIPNYLRHKVNPRIKENKKNATATATRKADDRKKKRKAHRDHKNRRTTTPANKNIGRSAATKSKMKRKTTAKRRHTTRSHTTHASTTHSATTLIPITSTTTTTTIKPQTAENSTNRS